MNLQLENKRALVSGSSAGIGEEIAKLLAAEGANVIVHGRKEPEAQRVADAINAAGRGRAAVALGDLGSDAEAAAVAEAARAAFGGGEVDILVNNAGAFPSAPWFESAAADWVRLYDANVGSMVRLSQALVPGMKAKGWGRVIVIASGVAHLPPPMQAAYSATKAANLNFAVGLAKELAGTGVTVNSVSPGPIHTPGNEELFRGMAKEQGWGEDWAEIERKAVETMMPQLSVPRFGRPEEIAAAVAYLCGPLADYVNATNLRVDGGYVGTVH